MSFVPASILIDGPTLYAQERDSNSRFAYHGLRQWAAECGIDVKEIVYFTNAVPRDRFVAIRPLVDWLTANDVSVVEAPCARYVRMALEAATVVRDGFSVLVVSGSEELSPLGSFVRAVGGKLLVCSTLKSLSTELKDAADTVFPLENTGLLTKFERTRKGEL